MRVEAASFRIIAAPMHRPRWIPLLAFLCAFIAPLAAQGTLRLTAAFNPTAVKAGAEADLVLTAIVTPGFHAYGSKEDLWDIKWIPLEINNPSFGFAIAARSPEGNNMLAKIDHIRIRVCFQ